VLSSVTWVAFKVSEIAKLDLNQQSKHT